VFRVHGFREGLGPPSAARGYLALSAILPVALRSSLKQMFGKVGIIIIL
jgi:hypothetical protein